MRRFMPDTEQPPTLHGVGGVMWRRGLQAPREAQILKGESFMSIWDFIELLTDDSVMVAVYDCRTEEENFCGEARELLFEDIRECEVLSFDLCNDDPRGVLLVLNIETEEEED